ncbi:unnamed protein product [Medioppia subpectinata]|uniref:Tyrosinase copper-binding domain-containing protein n=1 Tax=Medioppia subpectinata TaxID=1979941 RepID=A0A7R9KQM4_9ACAR|nr:unnamed protein product [Medioppia subpectinata]CAG2108021.1 unnamed protein product [Medioppia subpectinata]
MIALEIVKNYIQRRFASTDPLRPPCKTLRVRKDIKCLSKREMSDLIDVFKELYANGVMDLYSLVHGSYWPSIHKFSEAVPWHRWHINQFEREMRKINPKITLPYWEYITDFAAPEKSSIWKTFGRAGGRHNGYCVPDGAFAYQRVQYPNPHCLQRQWNTNKTMPVWEPPEWVTSLTQTSKTWGDFAQLLGYSAHFKIHLHVGGYEGEMSDIWATNDPVFYIFHAHVADYAILKWQLADDQNLLPISYNQGMKHDWQRDEITSADIENDYLTYYEKARIKEIFQIGFGDMCYIHDQLVQPILDIVAKKRPKLPKMARNLRKMLPNDVYENYFPKFAAKTATFFDYFLPVVHNGVHKPKGYCNELPIALSYNSTPNGRRLLGQLQTLAGIDVTPEALNAEQQYYEFIDDMNKYRYCSPYLLT